MALPTKNRNELLSIAVAPNALKLEFVRNMTQNVQNPAPSNSNVTGIVVPYKWSADWSKLPTYN